MKYYFCHFQDRALPLKIMAFVQQFKRHHNKDDAQSSRKAAKPLPAVVTLERITGLRAIIDGDTNIFVNQARSARHGHRLKAISELAFEDKFAATQTNESLPPIIERRNSRITPIPTQARFRWNETPRPHHQSYRQHRGLSIRPCHRNPTARR
jgi:hypothetical protein